VQNPFRTEEAAFHFLLLTIGAFALIVVAALINRWLGLAVALALTVAAIVMYTRQRTAREPMHLHVEPVSAEDERRILVVANETVAGGELRRLLEERSAGVREDILIICPALNSRLRHWASDEDPARAAAQGRLHASIARLAEHGIVAHGEIGDADPLQAMEDSMRTFAADEIVVSTHPPGRSHWLEQGVVENARERFDVPVFHVVVDLESQST
jgi:hypothetical protein